MADNKVPFLSGIMTSSTKADIPYESRGMIDLGRYQSAEERQSNCLLESGFFSAFVYVIERVRFLYPLSKSHGIGSGIYVRFHSLSCRAKNS